MLDNCKSAQERWGGVNNLIDQWLNERQSLLVDFCDLAAEKNYDESDFDQTILLRSLCQLLVDYTSAGHFEIYTQLVKEGQIHNDNDGLAAARKLIEKIDPTTDIILDFNDKYLETDDMSSLGKDLSQLGMALESRFAAEDQMIQVLHTAHSADTTH